MVFALVASIVLSGLLALLALDLAQARDTDLADPSAGITTEHAGGPRPPGAPAITLVDVTAELGLRPGPPAPRTRLLTEDTSGGVAWGDVDGDGDLDLAAAGLAPEDDPAGQPAARLWRADPHGFTDSTGSSGIADPETACLGMGVYFVDFDADGDVDLHLTCVGPDRLYRNRGDGVFDEVAEAAGVADSGWSTGAAWGDFDRDGHLDLYLARYVDFEHGDTAPPLSPQPGWEGMPFTLNPSSFDALPNRLFRNRGDDTFEELALPAGVADPGGRSLAVTTLDLDADGWLDLYVANDVSPNALLRNLTGRVGALVFEDLSAPTGSADPRGSMGLCAADLGAGSHPVDGRPDLFVTHWVAQENALYQTVATAAGFEVRDRTRVLGLGEVSLEYVGWGCAAIDLDLDGRLDLVVANGSTLEDRTDPMRLRPEPMLLMWNDGAMFRDLGPWAGAATSRPLHGRGLAAADFDRDGDVDLALARNRSSPLVLRNDTPRTGASLAVTFEGRPSRLRGARIEVVQGSSTQVRWLGSDASYLSSHALEMLFGLGSARGVDRIEAHWADGSRSVLGPQPAGRLVLDADSALP